MEPRWTEERVDRWIGLLLRTGVILSAVLVFFGGMDYLIRWGSRPAPYRIFHGVPLTLHDLGAIFLGTSEIRARAIIQIGLFVLIATPVARVAFSVVAFVLQRDRVYVAITLGVLAVLLISLFGGAFL